MRTLRFAVAMGAASLLVSASMGIASAAPTSKVASRGYEQRFTAFWTNKPAQPVTPVAGGTYTDVAIDGIVRFALQAGSGYATTGPIMLSGTTIRYTTYFYEHSAKHVIDSWFGSSSAMPRVDTALGYGIAGDYVQGVGRVEIGCAGYGAVLRTSWTWTGAYAPIGGYTQVETGQARACVPTLFINGVAKTDRDPSLLSSGMIGAYTVTSVVIWPR